jgi:hypothetical protein
MDINLYTNDSYREIKLKVKNRFNFDKVDSNYAANLIRDLKGGNNENKINRNN